MAMIGTSPFARDSKSGDGIVNSGEVRLIAFRSSYFELRLLITLFYRHNKKYEFDFKFFEL